jgi:RNA-binding protein
MEKTEPVTEVMVVQLGKAGITDSFIEEVRDQVKKKKTVKVKILRSAKGEKDREEIAAEVAKRCNAVLADVRGNTFVLTKR